MFLDSGALFDALDGRPAPVEALEDVRQISMSTISLTEYLEGRIEVGATDVEAELERVPGINWVPYTQRIARDAGRLQVDLEAAGARLNQRDLMIAATAVEVGDEFLVTDDGFQTAPIESQLSVTNLRG
jgi:predicted nucleic acid-binding protein